MTPSQAARIFKRGKSIQARLGPQMREASKVLVETIEQSGTTEFEGIGLAVDDREQLDVTKVRAHLGDGVDEFTKTVTSRTLFVIKAAK